jgi:hypothetical protein
MGNRIMGRRFLLLCMLFVIAGCSSTAPHMITRDYAKKVTRLVALMPVENRTNDQAAAKMLREKLLEELYFKGYPKIPLDFIDAKLIKVYGGDLSKTANSIASKAVGELLEVDAAMYCTLSESNTSIILFYSPTSLSMACELRSAKTGETLWQARYNTVERNFGYSRYNLEMKASQVYEAAIQEVVNKIMETLPDGPDLLVSMNESR